MQRLGAILSPRQETACADCPLRIWRRAQIARHLAAQLETVPDGVCPRCKGIGFLALDVPRDDPSFGLTRPCSCRRDAVLSQLPPYSFDNFKAVEGTEKALKAARAMAEGDGMPWLVLVSIPGTGKTHLAWAIIRRWIERGLHPRYHRMVDLLDWLREGIEAHDLPERSRQIAAAKYLVLDDMGLEKTETPWVRQEVDRLVDARYLARLPTVFTLNTFALPQLGADLPRVVSRWRDTSLCARPEITADDYRPRCNGVTNADVTGDVTGGGLDLGAH